MRPYQLALVVLLGALVPAARCQDAKLEPKAGQDWTNVLAGAKIKLSFSSRLADGGKARLVWTLTETVNGRVLPGGRGEAPLQPGAQGQAHGTVTVTFPAVKPGVVLKTNLVVALVDDGNALASHSKVIWVFHPNPFLHRKELFRDLKIALYDPDPAGKTAALLKDLELPLEEEKNLAALGQRKEGVVLVGEGASFADDPALVETLLALPRKGITVICLAPAAGTMPYPGANEERRENLSLYRRDIITKLDRRLDARTWGEGSSVASTLLLKVVDGQVGVEVARSAGGWPWMEVEYPDTRGRLIVCGFAVVGRWQASPTPRYLLARMLERALPPEPEAAEARR